MITYQCQTCGGSMSSPAELAGQTERCPACESLCRVPRPAAAPVRAPGKPVCQLCGGSLLPIMQNTRPAAARVLGCFFLAPGVLLLGMAPFLDPVRAVAAVGVTILPILIGVLLIGGRRKVWRCQACSTIVPRG